MKVASKFDNVIYFKRTLNHYEITNKFDYFIKKSDPKKFTTRYENLDYDMGMHASIIQDRVTFELSIYPNLYLT